MRLQYIFLLLVVWSAGILAQERSPYSFHYFKDYPRVLHFIENSYVNQDLPEDMAQISLQNMLWGVNKRYNLVKGPVHFPEWEKDLLEKWGIVLERNNQTPHIARIASGSPAESAGLHVGDILLSIQGQSTQLQNNYLISQALLIPDEVVLIVQVANALLPKHATITLCAPPIPWSPPVYECQDLENGISRIRNLRIEHFPNLGRMEYKAVILDMTTCNITTMQDLESWIGFFLPTIQPLEQSSLNGERITINTRNRAPTFSGDLILEVDEHVYGLSEVFCHMAKKTGSRILGTETAGFPYGQSWVAVDSELSIELAYWQFGFQNMGSVFEGPVHPDFYGTLGSTGALTKIEPLFRERLLFVQE